MSEVVARCVARACVASGLECVEVMNDYSTTEGACVVRARRGDRVLHLYDVMDLFRTGVI